MEPGARVKNDLNVRDAWYFTAGIGFLALAKAKNLTRGYSTPKPFALADTSRCIDYDLQVVEGWMRALASYTGSGTFLAGKDVLELGPGSDLGVGVVLLARGAKSYSACDVNDLAKHAPRSFYDALLGRLARAYPGSATGRLREELDAMESGVPSRIRYTVQQSLDLTAAVGAGTMDVVVSQAAFEHFRDVESIVRQLSRVCRPGAVLVAEIDLKTHSRWIRDKDPNNIYRYPDGIYDAFRFRGSPNRMRPYQYRAAFERCGWTNIHMSPLTRLDPAFRGTSGMNLRFADAVNQMDYLTVLFCATKQREPKRGANATGSNPWT
jgi:SAM-dependent methyltransferase